LALGLKSTYTREMHLAFCPSLLTLLPSSPPSERTNKPTSSVEVARLFPRIATHRRAARPMDSDPATRRSTSFENLAPPGAGSNLSDPIKQPADVSPANALAYGSRVNDGFWWAERCSGAPLLLPTISYDKLRFSAIWCAPR
jgi:hypothetical protein